MFSSMKVTMEVWRVMGRATISDLRPAKNFFCSQLMKSQPVRVQKM